MGVHILEAHSHNFNLFEPSGEHGLLRQTVARFVESEVEPQALEHDRKEKFNLALLRKLGQLGLLGLTVSDAYGGSAMDALAAVIVHEELAMSDPGFCLAYLAHSMLCVNNISVNASHEQKVKFLPKLCSGEWIGAMAMSEPKVGTDVLAMETSAQLKSAAPDSPYVLNGRKMWITNGVVDDQNTLADVVLVYARTGGQSETASISTFLVEAGTPGFEAGQKIRDKAGMRASNTAELVFDHCEISRKNLLGAPGESLKHMMRNLEIERITLAAMALGIARRSLLIMNRYANERIAFQKHLSEFGQIQRHIAESFSEYYAARSYVYDVARRHELSSEGRGESCNEGGRRLHSDGVKLFATTAAKNIADRAIQVLGGYGYVGEYVVERLWRDSKLLEIGGGTLEAHQKNITRDLAQHPEWLD